MNPECASCECPKKINQLSIVSVSFAVICLLALIRDDQIGITAGGTIKLPFFGVDVDSGSFLFVGPAVLLFIISYLHIYVQQWFACSWDQEKKTCVVKIDSALGRFFYHFIYFGLSPAVLLVFYLISRGKPDHMYYVGFIFAVATGLMPFFFFAYRKMWRMWIGSTVFFFMFLGTVCFLFSQKFDPANYFPLRLPGAKLENHNMLPYNLKGMRAETAVFKNCVFYQKYMPDLSAPRATFDGSNLYGAHLNGADLGSASFVGAELSKASLIKTELSNGKFNNAKLIDANLFSARLEGACMEGADLSGAWLLSAKMKAANLKNSILRNAVFTGVDLSDVNLAGADLAGASFIEARMPGADLSLAKNLSPDQLETACGDIKTKLPFKFSLDKCEKEEVIQTRR